MIYVPPCGPSNSKIMLVGEAPGVNEELKREPFVGTAGYELSKELHEAGLLKTECFITNVSRFRPPNNEISCFIEEAKRSKACPTDKIPFEGKWVAPHIPEHIGHLQKEVQLVNPNVIVALGNAALWALTGKDGIMNWRGSEMASHKFFRADGKPYKVIPVMHPAYILRQYNDRFINTEYFRRVAREAKTPELYKAPYDFLIRPTPDQAIGFLSSMLQRMDAGPLRFTVDIETRSRHIACIGFGLSKFRAACIPLMCVERASGYWQPHEELIMMKLMVDVLMHPNAQVIMQNGNYDRSYIATYMLSWPKLYRDTMTVQHTLFPGLEKSLDFLAAMYCDHYTWWKSESKEWDKSLGEDQLWYYNCKDCCYTFEVSEAQEPAIEKMHKQAQVAEQMAVMDPALRMMLRGMRRDEEITKELSQELAQEIESRSQYLERILQHPLNPRSGPQMKALFYDDLKLPVIFDRKTRQPTLSEKALEELATKEPLIRPLVDAISDMRSLGVYKSTFVDAVLSADRRIRSSFKTTGAETYRWASSKDNFGDGANLQNIPKGTDGIIARLVKLHGPCTKAALMEMLSISDEAKFASMLDKEEDAGFITVEASQAGTGVVVKYGLLKPNIRKLFIADPGCVIMDWDLDRADLQVVVWEADDEELRQALREGADIHSLNAKALGSSRDMAKRFVHGTNYGGSYRTMARNCGLTNHQSETMQKRWFAAHPGIKAWHERTEKQLQATRTVTNKFGYSRIYFDRVEGLLPEALAWVPQSTVALVITKTILRVEAQLYPNVETMLQVHDSLVLQTPVSNFPGCVPQIKDCFKVTIPYEKPLIIPASGKWSTVSWGAAKDIKLDELNVQLIAN